MVSARDGLQLAAGYPCLLRMQADSKVIEVGSVSFVIISLKLKEICNLLRII
jgi:hypothetical protein